MKTFICSLLLLASLPALAQNVRFDAPFPSVSSASTTPYLVANVPPNSPVLAVCNSPANAVPCTNYATTYTSAGVACPNGAQDTPQPQPSACQASGDAQGNIGFWAPPAKYDYTVCVGTNCYGPYTVTIGGGSSSVAGATPNGGLLLTGGTTLGLLTSCNAPNVEIYNGTAWICGNQIPITNVAGLASVLGKQNGSLAVVTNGSSALDCSSGGGANTVLCQFNGSGWSAVASAGKQLVDVRDYGAVGDAQLATDCSSISGSAVINCSTSHFTSADIGKVIVLWQAGLIYSVNFTEPLSATILTVNSGTQVTLSVAAGATINPSPHTAWGTNNQTAVTNAINNSTCSKTNAGDQSGCTLYFPHGYYLLQMIEFPCGALGTFGPYTCTTFSKNITITGDSATTTHLENWDGNEANTICAAYTYTCGLISFGAHSTNEGSFSDAAHVVQGVTIKDMRLTQAPYGAGNFFKSNGVVSLGLTKDSELRNTFIEGSSYLCVSGGGGTMPNANMKIHDNFLRFCGWGGPAIGNSQAALNPIAPYTKIYNNTVYYSAQCVETSAPFVEVLNNRCEALDDVTGAAMPAYVNPQWCLNFDSSTYGFWDMTIIGNLCRHYGSGGYIVNTVNVMSNIDMEDNTFVNTQSFTLQGGIEGPTTGWPNGLLPPQVHGTSYFVNNKFIFDGSFTAGLQTIGIILNSAKEKWVIDRNTIVLAGSLNGSNCTSCNGLKLIGGIPGWQPSTTYTVSLTAPSYVQPSIPNSFWYATLAAGTTCTSGAAPGPTFPTVIGNTVADGTCTWKNMGPKPVHAISNLSIAFPTGSTNNQWVVWNQGVLPSDFTISNLQVSGGLIGGVPESQYQTAVSFGLQGFPPSWSPTTGLRIREGLPFGNANLLSSNSAIPGGNYYRVGDTVYQHIPAATTSPGWVTLTAGWHANAWIATHAYVYNDIIQAVTDNGHVFVAQGTCTSGTPEPTWNLGAGTITADNAGGGTCSWKEAGADATFGKIAALQ
jgi:hypothetical protein